MPRTAFLMVFIAAFALTVRSAASENGKEKTMFEEDTIKTSAAISTSRSSATEQ